jgi:acyl carrier protein
MMIELLPKAATAGPPAMEQPSPSSMRHIVESEVARVMGIPPSETIPADRPLSDLGLDSLMAVELRNSFARIVGHSLPASLLFNYPTIASLATYLEGQSQPADAAAPDEGESELADRLAAKLRQLR